jgi:hypothetical protein
MRWANNTCRCKEDEASYHGGERRCEIYGYAAAERVPDYVESVWSLGDGGGRDDDENLAAVQAGIKG